MSAFTFDFDLEDDLDESFDAIPPKPSVPPINTVPAPEGTEQPAEEIPLSDLVRTHAFVVHRCLPPRASAQLSALPEALSYSPLALPASGPTLVRRDLFDARFQLLAQGRDEQAALVDAPADLVPGVYEGGLKTWECALDLAAYIDREVPRVRGLRVLEVSTDGSSSFH
jgi:protein-histidine N-methyltransferase